MGPSLAEIENIAFKFFDEYGIAYKINTGISITLDLYNEFDDIERLINNIYRAEDIRDIKNWESFKNMEFVIPSILKSKIDLELYQEVVYSYFKSTFILLNKSISESSLEKKGLLHIESHYGESLNKSRMFTDIWGYGLRGVFIMPQKNITGDVRLNKPNLHKSIQTINGNLIINTELKDLGFLTTVEGDLIFSSMVTQTKLKSLKPIQEVGGNCILNNLIIELDSLKTVQGNLNIRKCLIKSLNTNIIIGGNFLLSRYNFPLLKDKLEYIDLKGKKRIYSDYYDLNSTDDHWVDFIEKIDN